MSIIKFIKITIAALMYAAGVSLFLDANNIVPGGVTGTAVILNRLLGVETGTMVFMINIPLLLISIWKFGLKFLLTTIYVIMVSSILMNVFSTYGGMTDDLLMAALVGGSLVAFSLGILFKSGTSTGGVDIVVKMIKTRQPHIKSGRIFLIIDSIVVITYTLIFGNINAGLYSALTVIVTSTVLDFVLYGKDEAKILYIISKSENSENELVKRLLGELDVGVTYLKGYGAYKYVEKRVIMCAIRKQQLPKAKEIVKQTDSEAFMIITSANEIIGKGYKSYNISI